MGKSGGDPREPRATRPVRPPARADVCKRLRLVGDDPHTEFEFTHLIPEDQEHPRYLITTDPLDLRERDVWRERAQQLVNAGAAEGDGRVIFCVHLGEVERKVAAIRFHFDGPRRPLLVLAIAERYDEHRDESEGCVHVLKRYLHLFSLCIGGDGVLLYDAPTGEQETRARDIYEFRSAPRDRFPRRPGGIALMQDPPEDGVPTTPGRR